MLLTLSNIKLKSVALLTEKLSRFKVVSDTSSANMPVANNNEVVSNEDKSKDVSKLHIPNMPCIVVTLLVSKFDKSIVVIGTESNIFVISVTLLVSNEERSKLILVGFVFKLKSSSNIFLYPSPANI